MSQGLGDVYVKHMRHHGCGVALFQPIAFADIKPPCCGFFDRNGKWNLIARLSTELDETTLTRDLKPLSRGTAPMREIGLRWQPKTSKGVRMWNVDITGEIPDIGIPVGAEAHVKYQSKTKFGAVLIARNPVNVTAINDEILFKDWVESNKAVLYSRFGRELKRYGLWVVTVTFSAPGCSINAWLDKDKQALLSAKVKAKMAGDYGGSVSWEDHITDKDWAHYSGDLYRRRGKETPPNPHCPVAMGGGEAKSSSGNQHQSSSPAPKARPLNTKHSQGSANDTNLKTSASSNEKPVRRLSRKAALSPVGDTARKPSPQGNATPDGKAHKSSSKASKRTSAMTEPSVANSGASHVSDPFTRTKETPATNDGVVLFFDGLRVGQFEWYLEGLKSIAISVLHSDSDGTNDNMPSHVQDQGLKNSPQSPGGRSSSWEKPKVHDEYYPSYGPPYHGGEEHDSFDDDYDPEKDEGVYPSDWPRKSPSLLSCRNDHLAGADGQADYAHVHDHNTDRSPSYRQTKRHSKHFQLTSHKEMTDHSD